MDGTVFRWRGETAGGAAAAIPPPYAEMAKGKWEQGVMKWGRVTAIVFE